MGIVWHNSFDYIPIGETVEKGFIWFRKEFLDLIKSTKGVEIDLITCSLNDPIFKREVEILEKNYKVKINYSLNETGNSVDWIMESSKESIKEIYFNEKLSEYKQVLGGSANSHSAIIIDGKLWTFGNNFYGQLGLGYYSSRVLTPTEVPGLSNVVAVACGQYHTAVILSDGRLWTFGSNNDGQLGLQNNIGYNTPQQVSLSNVVAVACGGFHTAAILSDGSLWTFGDNQFGQLGLEDNIVYNKPQQVKTLSNVIAVACGIAHTAAILSDGSLWTFGYNNKGQLGLGNTKTGASYNTPQQVAILDVVAVACGFYHTAAIVSDGTLWTFGDNNRGQLGLGNNTDYNTPQQVSLSNVIAVACGGSHTTTILSDESLWAFGYNVQGQLGLENNINYNTPQQVKSLSNVILVACGFYYTAIILSDGSLWTFGDNSRGQLGLGNNINYNKPQKVTTYTCVANLFDNVARAVAKIDSDQEMIFPGSMVSIKLDRSFGKLYFNTDYLVSTQILEITSGKCFTPSLLADNTQPTTKRSTGNGSVDGVYTFILPSTLSTGTYSFRLFFGNRLIFDPNLPSFTVLEIPTITPIPVSNVSTGSRVLIAKQTPITPIPTSMALTVGQITYTDGLEYLDGDIYFTIPTDMANFNGITVLNTKYELLSINTDIPMTILPDPKITVVSNPPQAKMGDSVKVATIDTPNIPISSQTMIIDNVSYTLRRDGNDLYLDLPSNTLFPPSTVGEVVVVWDISGFPISAGFSTLTIIQPDFIPASSIVATPLSLVTLGKVTAYLDKTSASSMTLIIGDRIYPVSYEFLTGEVKMFAPNVGQTSANLKIDWIFNPIFTKAFDFQVNFSPKILVSGLNAGTVLAQQATGSPIPIATVYATYVAMTKDDITISYNGQSSKASSYNSSTGSVYFSPEFRGNSGLQDPTVSFADSRLPSVQSQIEIINPSVTPIDVSGAALGQIVKVANVPYGIPSNYTFDGYNPTGSSIGSFPLSLTDNAYYLTITQEFYDTYSVSNQYRLTVYFNYRNGNKSFSDNVSISLYPIPVLVAISNTNPPIIPGQEISMAQAINSVPIQNVILTPSWSWRIDGSFIKATVPLNATFEELTVQGEVFWVPAYPSSPFTSDVRILIPNAEPVNSVDVVSGTEIILAIVTTPEISVSSVSNSLGWSTRYEAPNVYATVSTSASGQQYPITTINWAVPYPSKQVTSSVSILVPSISVYSTSGFVDQTVTVGKINNLLSFVTGVKVIIDSIEYNATWDNSGNVKLLLQPSMIGDHEPISIKVSYSSIPTQTAIGGSLSVGGNILFTPIGPDTLLPYVPRQVFSMSSTTSTAISARAYLGDIDMGAVGIEGSNPTYFNFAYVKNHLNGVNTIEYRILMRTPNNTEYEEKYRKQYTTEGTVDFPIAPQDGSKIFSWAITSNLIVNSPSTKIDPAAIFKINMSNPKYNSIKINGKWSYVGLPLSKDFVYDGNVKQLVFRPNDDKYKFYSCSGNFCSGAPSTLYYNNSEIPLKNSNYGNMIAYHQGKTIKFNPNLIQENGECVISYTNSARLLSKDSSVPSISWVKTDDSKLVEEAETYLATIDANHYVSVEIFVSGQSLVKDKVKVEKTEDGKIKVYANLLDIPITKEISVISIVVHFSPELDATYVANFLLVKQAEGSFTVSKIGCCVKVVGAGYGESVKIKWGDCHKTRLETENGEFTATHCYKKSGCFTIKVKGETTKEEEIYVKGCKC